MFEQEYKNLIINMSTSIVHCDIIHKRTKSCLTKEKIAQVKEQISETLQSCETNKDLFFECEERMVLVYFANLLEKIKELNNSLVNINKVNENND
jgi:hypothetical protein